MTCQEKPKSTGLSYPCRFRAPSGDPKAYTAPTCVLPTTLHTVGSGTDPMDAFASCRQKQSNRRVLQRLTHQLWQDMMPHLAALTSNLAPNRANRHASFPLPNGPSNGESSCRSITLIGRSRMCFLVLGLKLECLLRAYKRSLLRIGPVRCCVGISEQRSSS